MAREGSLFPNNAHSSSCILHKYLRLQTFCRRFFEKNTATKYLKLPNGDFLGSSSIYLARYTRPNANNDLVGCFQQGVEFSCYLESFYDAKQRLFQNLEKILMKGREPHNLFRLTTV